MRKECRILQHIADDLFIMSEYPPSSCDFKSEQSSAKTLTLVKISTNLRYLIFVSTCIFSLFLKICLILTKTATVLLITGIWAVFVRILFTVHDVVFINKNAETNQEKGQPDTGASLFLEIFILFFFFTKNFCWFRICLFAKINLCKLWSIFRLFYLFNL